jgi:hypothetical protein
MTERREPIQHNPKPGSSPGSSSGNQPERRLALRVTMMPRDTNHYGTIFGGVILSLIDQAGFVEARTHGSHRWVTAAIDRVEFVAPVQVGDVVSLLTKTVRDGQGGARDIGDDDDGVGGCSGCADAVCGRVRKFHR